MKPVQNAHQGLAASLHRLLIRRLVGMTALVCVVFGGAATLHQAARYDEAIIQTTLRGAENFRELILPVLDAPGPVDGARIQAVLDAIPDDALRAGRAGATVSARIVDQDSRLLARRALRSYPLAGAVAAYLEKNSYAFRPGDAVQLQRVVRIGGKAHLHMAVSLADSKGKTAAYVESVYAVSDQVLRDVWGEALRTVALVVIVALATSLLLYPVITRMLRRLTRLSATLQDANLETLRVLGSAIAKRDSDTDLHNYRVTIYSVRLAEALGLPDGTIRSLVKGAMLHDVGKIGVRDAVLLKPGSLTGRESEEMHAHVQHGRDIVSQSSWLADAMEVVSAHHERYDGQGYDAGLAGDRIPLAARVFAVADVFDALTSRRPYKEPYPFAEAMRLLELERGTHFDPGVVDAFRRIAPGLYEGVRAMDEAGLKQTLSGIFETYFTSDMETLVQGVEELVSGRKAATAAPEARPARPDE